MPRFLVVLENQQTYSRTATYLHIDDGDSVRQEAAELAATLARETMTPASIPGQEWAVTVYDDHGTKVASMTVVATRPRPMAH